MKESMFIDKIVTWYKSTGDSIRPSRQLPGRWRLFEYYAEPEDQLINMTEDQLKKNDLFLELRFEAHGQLEHKTNLPVQFFKETSGSTWYTSRNFIVVGDKTDDNKSLEFQYAIINGTLKLLKKNPTGKIDFFGFFRKIESTWYGHI